MKAKLPSKIATLMPAALLAAMAGTTQNTALAGTSADVARKCLHYSYLVYPYKRPGSVPMSGDRQAYFRDCVAKEGKIPEPAPRKS
jgi:hypothetical protein